MHALIDIGANLTHDSFDRDRSEVIARARGAGVGRMIVTGTTVAASTAAVALARKWPGTLYATAGVHPHHAGEWSDAGAAELRTLLEDAVTVAAGECGLDFFRDFAPRDAQRRAFAAQLQIAADARKPVFLHQRDAHEDFLGILAPVRPQLVGGVAHCFTGGPEELRDYLALDLYIGVTGWVCDERRGAALRSALPFLSLERLLLETDAPYLVPRDLRPQPHARRNEPAFLPHVLARVAAEMGRDPSTVAAAATANTEKLFGLR